MGAIGWCVLKEGGSVLRGELSLFRYRHINDLSSYNVNTEKNMTEIKHHYVFTKKIKMSLILLLVNDYNFYITVVV